MFGFLEIHFSATGLSSISCRSMVIVYLLDDKIESIVDDIKRGFHPFVVFGFI